MTIVSIFVGDFLHVIEHLVSALNQAVFSPQGEHDREIPLLEVPADRFAVLVALFRGHRKGRILEGDFALLAVVG